MSDPFDINRARKAFDTADPGPLSAESRRVALTRFAQLERSPAPALLFRSVIASRQRILQSTICSAAFIAGLLVASVATPSQTPEAELADAATFSMSLFQE